MTEGLRPTSRDVLLLKDIHDNSFLSFYQIHEGHFKDRARPTVYNRLAKLLRARLVESIHINLFAHHRNNELVGVIYRLTKTGTERLQDFLQGETIKFNPMSLNLSCLYHDMLLIDVLRKMQTRLPHLKMLNTNSNRLGPELRERIPDAILFDPLKKMNVALELELTAKSAPRYRDIILSYRTSNQFEKILYIVKDESIQRKIGGLITGFNGQYSLGDDTDKFEFVTLNNFFNGTAKEDMHEL